MLTYTRVCYKIVHYSWIYMTRYYLQFAEFSIPFNDMKYGMIRSQHIIMQGTPFPPHNLYGIPIGCMYRAQVIIDLDTMNILKNRHDHDRSITADQAFPHLSEWLLAAETIHS